MVPFGRIAKIRISALLVLLFLSIGCSEDVIPQEEGFEVVNISNMPYNSEFPSIAVGPNGDIYVFWRQDHPDPESSGIYFTSRSTEGKWSDAAFVCDGGQPDVKVNKDGTIHLAYQHVGQYYEIYYIKKPQGGNWTYPEIISALGTSAEPQFEIDKWDNIHLIWVEIIDSRIFYSKRSPNGTWSSPIELNRESAFHRYHHRITVNAQGDAHVVWTNVVTDYGPDLLLYTTNCLGDTWSYPAALDSNDYMVIFNSDIAVDNRGTIYVIWCDDEDGLLYRYNKFRKWSEPVILDSLGGTLPHLKVDKYDRLHLVYNRSGGTFYRCKLAYGEWADPVYLTSISPPLGFANHSGNIYLVVEKEYDIFFVEGPNLY